MIERNRGPASPARRDGRSLLVDRALALALRTSGRIRNECARSRDLIADVRRRLDERPDDALLWGAMPHVVEALLADDPASLADLVRRAGGDGAFHDNAALHAAASEAILRRDPAFRTAALAYLRTGRRVDRLHRRPVPAAELLEQAAHQLPWQTRDLHERVARLAQLRPGRDGSARIIPFVGPRGSGKTDAAEWLARVWHRAGVVDHSTIWPIGAAGLLGYGAAYQTVSQAFRRVVLVEGRGFDAADSYAQPADLDHLVRELERPGAPVVILAMRSRAHVRAFTGLHDDLPALMAPMLEFTAPTLGALAREVLIPGFDGDEDEYVDALRRLRQRPGWSGVRSARQLRSALRMTGSDQSIATALDVLAPREQDTTLDELLQELDDLVGLDGFKASVLAQLDAVHEDRDRRAQGLPPLMTLGHHAFVGPPGTGKTTAARLLARILHAAGALPRAEVVEVSRADLVAQYVGQSASRTARVVDQAAGGVLFIDEAYALDGHAENDFGRESLAVLVAEMENRRGDLVVVFAGYEEETMAMISLNAGLRSRISTISRFSALSPDQQVSVFADLCARAGLQTDAATLVAVRSALAGDPTGGNARAARTLYERAIIARASRLRLVGGAAGVVASDIPLP